ncbi:MAG: hypothetical protein FGM55_00875 [Rhodoferax sp.]|nr:hypothetical protein [Rhodoferax sp.]
MVTPDRLLLWVVLASAGIGAQASGPGSGACPTPDAVSPIHLYGLWQATVEEQKEVLLLELVRHPEWQGSLSGRLQRPSGWVQVSGDIEDGELTLEESGDGRTVTGLWHGSAVDGSCGKEIRGTWNAAQDRRLLGFTLRKRAGWD